MSRIVQARLDDDTQRVLARLRRASGLTDSEILRRGVHRLALDLTPARPRRIVGLGKFASGVRDLGTNKARLRGFGRS